MNGIQKRLDGRIVHSSHRICQATKMAKYLSEDIRQVAYNIFVLWHILMMLRHTYMKHMQHIKEAMRNAGARIFMFLCLHMQYETQ